MMTTNVNLQLTSVSPSTLLNTHRKQACERLQIMSSEISTSWTEYDNSVTKILSLASQTLRIFDQDLSKLKLERPDHAEYLRLFLSAGPRQSLQIVIKNAEPFRRSSPRLMKLLSLYPQCMTIIECPPHVAALNDSLLIADNNHALIRFHTDHARAKTLLDTTEECAPYLFRFEDIMKEGGEQISATLLGL